MNVFKANKPGYLLIELLVYISGSALLILVFMSMVSNFYQSSLNNIYIMNNYLENYMRFGLLRRHLRMINYQDIRKIEKFKLAFILGGKNCSWEFKNGNLVFLKNGNSSLVLHRILFFDFIKQDNNSVLVRAICNNKLTINSYIGFRNGLIV